jgi:hypothetical protein
MLHYLQISKLAETKDKQEKPIPLFITYVKKTGEVEKYEYARCTSSHFRPASINIELPNGDIKKLRCINIIKINGNETFI